MTVSLENFENNPILFSDSYKFSHFLQDPEGTTQKIGYSTARVNACGVDVPGVIHFGPWYYVNKWLSKPITKEMIDQAEFYIGQHGTAFNRKGWEEILNKFGGYFPVEILEVPEGMLVPFNLPSVNVRSSEGAPAWVQAYVETLLLSYQWYMSTVATNSWAIKKMIMAFMLKSCDNINGLPFKLHDFGFRGASSPETAMIGGMAHLVNFWGTDTFPAALGALSYYGAKSMPGFSINASEHSTTTIWGRDKERECYQNLINKFGVSGGMFACVIDSWNDETAIYSHWGSDAFQEQLKAGGFTVVLRPDSGDPVENPIKLLNLMMQRFGFYVNSKGYRVLPDYIRMIQGDGLDYFTIQRLISRLDEEMISMDNLAFGMGGGLLQKVNRDDYGFAMKTSRALVNGEERSVSKDPAGCAWKKSKEGDLRLIQPNGYPVYDWASVEDIPEGYEEVMQPIYKNGRLFNQPRFDDVRTRASSFLMV